jgi:hypothetical protein
MGWRRTSVEFEARLAHMGQMQDLLLGLPVWFDDQHSF